MESILVWTPTLPWIEGISCIRKQALHRTQVWLTLHTARRGTNTESCSILSHERNLCRYTGLLLSLEWKTCYASSNSNTHTLQKTHDWQKISHWPAAVITKNIRWFKNLLTSQKLLENAIYPFPEIGSDGKHHSNSDMWEMLLVTLNNEAHGCTKHTKWTHIHAADGNLNTSRLISVLQDTMKWCSYFLSTTITFFQLHIIVAKLSEEKYSLMIKSFRWKPKHEKCNPWVWDGGEPSGQHRSLCEVEAFVVNTRKAVERGNGVWNHYRKCMLKQGLSQIWLP